MATGDKPDSRAAADHHDRLPGQFRVYPKVNA
jgi:hypothetical protein